VSTIIKIKDLTKIYADGFEALKGINLEIRRGEIFALLGPNGAGKTTLIGIICGIVNATRGKVTVNGLDVQRDYLKTRAVIGYVPQELTTETFESVLDTVAYSRGLFGKKPDPAYLEKVLRALSLWDRKDNTIMTLSGGMKRRVLIAKALSHQPDILFLDEPTAGVDVELRKEMWQVVRDLRDSGVTVILTTHYIEEAEEMADRVGVINHGQLVLVEDKSNLMLKLGSKQLTLELHKAIKRIPKSLQRDGLALSDDGRKLVHTYDTQGKRTGITALLNDLNKAGMNFRDLSTSQTSLEEIFVELVEDKN
jgi:ABC-2 type transport system ATP-binding protein